jgi:hypothetical protein
VLHNGRWDVHAANRPGRALYAAAFADPRRPANLARYLFLDPEARLFYVDWERQAEGAVALLRAEVGRHPYDDELSDLIGELLDGSDFFRRWWAVHDVRRLGGALRARIHHPRVGDLTLTYEALAISAIPGLTIGIWTAAPGSASEAGVRALACDHGGAPYEMAGARRLGL